MKVDYQLYAQVENYLFGTVSAFFGERGYLTAFQFFTIIRWKANRAISRVARRILSKSPSDLEDGVATLTRAIARAPDPRTKMQILIEDWGFRLPIASAILTVCYPEIFTVYDVRTCETLGRFSEVAYKSNFDRIWNGYSAFMEAVKRETPESLTLRDKDRWLWGKSAYNQLKAQLEKGFGA